MALAAKLRDDSAENHVRIVYLFLVVLLWTVFFLWRRDQVLAEPDLLWHIKTGEWIWQNGQVPHADPFSYTFAGKPWIAKEWLSQLFFFGVYSAVRWTGIILMGVTAVGLGVGLLYWVLSRDLSPILAAFACLMGIMLASPAFTVRPHLLTLALIILWTHQMFTAAREERAPHFGWLLVLILWANLHAAFTMGFVIAFFAFLDFLERTRLAQKEEAIWWIVFLVLCPVASLLHPYLWKAMFATFSIVGPNEAVPMISEWQPFTAPDLLLHEGALLILIFGAMVSGFRLGYAKALLIIVLLHLFLTHLRYAYFLFPILPILLAPELARQFPQLSAEFWRSQPRDPLEKASSRHFGLVRAGFVAVLLGMAAVQALVLRPAPPEGSSLVRALDFVKKNGVSGNVFNYYDFGGALIFNGIPSFLDGRTDQLFLGGFAKKFTLGPTGESELAAALRQYDVTWTLLPPEDKRIPVMDSLPGWKRVYSDKAAVIHQRQLSPP